MARTIGTYEDRGLLGEGASGQVRRVYDATLERTVAMKILRAELASSPRAVATFEAEARVLARLSHPGIVPVHAIGRLPDGRPFYTMDEIKGRTLKEVARALHAASSGGQWADVDGWALRRLLEAFVRATKTVAYSHACGIVHGDLKPSNVMLGAFGEVLVLDWGLAERTPQERAKPAPSGGEELRRLDASALEEEVPSPRRSGTTGVRGTAAYMPPERAAAAVAPDPRADVYSLGATLYEILCGHAPYSGTSSWVILVQLASRPPERLPAVARRLGGPPVPDELASVVERAMARDPADRYPDAGALAADLLAWLDGARRREEALAFVAIADAIAPRLAAIHAEVAEHLDRAAELKRRVEPAAPVAEKVPIWDAEDAAATLRTTARQLETERLQALRDALARSPELPEAHERLADHYRARHAAAEAARDRGGAVEFETLLRAHDRGHHAAWLKGDGALTLRTDPPGAEAVLYRYVERQRRLEPERVRSLGQTPIEAVALPAGSWLVTLELPGRPVVRYPVEIGRLQHWDGVPPEGGEPVPVPIPASLTPDEVYIPPGWFVAGGDPVLLVPPRRRLWADAMVFRRFAVTHAEYLQFLDALVEEGREDEALANVPRERGGASPNGPALYARGADGRFVAAPDPDGAPWDDGYPVAMIDWRNAMAFAAWDARRTGLPWRLPGEWEWEKAARGVDGRLLPWGDYVDPTWTCCFESHTGPHRSPATRAQFHADASPYGVLHMAGNMRSWTADRYRLEGPPTPNGRVLLPEALGDTADHGPAQRCWRGGGFLDYARALRSTARTSGPATDRFSRLGMRLARSYTG